MKLLLFSIVIISLAALMSCAQKPKPGVWSSRGEPVENSKDRKAVDGFGAHLAVVRDPKGFAEMWYKPEQPNFDTVKEVAHDEMLGVIVLFAGCTPDAEGKCNTEVDYRIFNPNGSLNNEQKNQTLWKDVAPLKPNTHLGNAVLMFKLPVGFREGIYKVEATVRDLNANVSFDLETQFVLK